MDEDVTTKIQSIEAFNGVAKAASFFVGAPGRSQAEQPRYDTCRLRRPNVVWLHAMFTRWANNLFIHGRQASPSRLHPTTTDFLASMAADHDRRALAAVLCKSFPS